MKRKSNLNIHQILKNFSHDDTELECVRRQAKRNFTTFRPRSEPFITNQNNIFQINQNQFRDSFTVVNQLLNEVINELKHDIEIVQRRKIVASATHLTCSVENALYKLQDPEVDYNQVCAIPQEEPVKNTTDPISGFSKHNFVKKLTVRLNMSNNDSYILLKDAPEESTGLSNLNQKKLLPLIKQSSQRKLQSKTFVPLSDNQNPIDRKSCIDFEQLTRQRLLKQIENKKFKQEIQVISAMKQKLKKGSKRNNKSTNKSVQEFNNKDDYNYNFDYDGNKINLYDNSGKVKSNLKILKALYKLPKQRPQEKPAKPQQKLHQKVSFMPRCSRNYTQINNKTIGDFCDINYSATLKEKLQIQLRKTDVKFVQRQYHEQERERKDSLLV